MNKMIPKLALMGSTATFSMMLMTPAAAVSIILGGESIDVFARRSNFGFRREAILPSLQRTPWWGNRELAAEAAAQVQDQLGTFPASRGRRGVFFAYQLSEDGRGVFGALWENGINFPTADSVINTEARDGLFPMPPRPDGRVIPRVRPRTNYFAVIPEPETILGSMLTLGIFLALKHKKS